MPCYSPLKGWKDFNTGGITFRREFGYEKMEVACGQCLGCRLDNSRMWAMRIAHEASVHEYNGGNCFVTLTYRDKIECDAEQLRMGYHVPDDWSLHKSHFREFMKRLRKVVDPQRIKYFVAGEYGQRCKHGIQLDLVDCPLCNVGRPHYHACLFNLSFPDLESYQCDNGVMRYTSPLLEKIWRYGFVDVGELNYESAAYVARYCLKKVNGNMADEHYRQCDIDGNCVWVTPEFALMSRGARKGARGLGYEWFERYKEDVFPSDEVPVPGSGVFKGVPRYYDELFKDSNPVAFEEIKKLREKFKKEHSADYTPERLMAKYKVAKAKQKLFGGRE